MPETALVAGDRSATILIETAVLAVALSSRHGRGVRSFAGIWLSGCTPPLVWFVVPRLLPADAARGWSLVAAETLAPVVECGLVWQAFIRPLPRDPRATRRDLAAIVVANIVSFAVGEAAWRLAGLT
ncbi:MAG: hypothetical protein FJ284_10230 [Planctomycetes bacterium]|nr:hypothetical protein [Planctomycetota bacterium]